MVSISTVRHLTFLQETRMLLDTEENQQKSSKETSWLPFLKIQGVSC